MLRIAKIDEELATLNKPPLEEVDSVRLQDGDCLVLCSGFEDRAITFLKDATEHPNQFRVVVVNYLPFMDEKRRTEVHNICEAARVAYSELTYDRQDPSGFGDSFPNA